MTHDYKKKNVKGRGYNHVWTEKKLEALGDELIDFCQNSEHIHLASFTVKYKKPRSWLYDIAKRNPIFLEKLDMAMELMAAKMSSACWSDKDKNATFGEKYLPIYDSNYKDLIQWKEDIKKRDLSEKDANLIVNAVKFTQQAVDDDNESN